MTTFYNPADMALRARFTPQTREVTGFRDRMAQLDLGFDQIYLRNVSRTRLDHILATGTDRDNDSELYNDDNVEFESMHRYEEFAMYIHGINDRRFTTYLHEPDKRSDRQTLTQSEDSQHIELVYRKDPRVVKISAEDINPNCVPRSNGFALFKDEPMKLLVGIAVDGKFYTPCELRTQRVKAANNLGIDPDSQPA